VTHESLQGLQIPLGSGALAAILHLPERLPAPALVCSHGLLSSKDGSKFSQLGVVFGAAGFAVIRFDFTGCGGSTAAHLDTLVATRVRDLDTVIEFIRRQSWWDGKLALLGSSFGGTVSLLAAAARPQLVSAMACWATPFDLGAIAGGLEGAPRTTVRFPAGHRLGEPNHLGNLPALKNVLVVHGGSDEIVPCRDAVSIYQRLGEPRRLLIMEPADHRFLDPDWRRQALDASLDWLSRLMA
jgi:alpha-beta hydrolase superfamily lysophospholipase